MYRFQPCYAATQGHLLVLLLLLQLTCTGVVRSLRSSGHLNSSYLCFCPQRRRRNGFRVMVLATQLLELSAVQLLLLDQWQRLLYVHDTDNVDYSPIVRERISVSFAVGQVAVI